MSNRLAKETSPYLQQHAANPVDWYAWGPEALERARAEDRPILLSIGYSACHWCHVMAHESFEDPEVAALMNRHYVCIKVDREERPDLDQIYQSAQQMLAQRGGGWPLTMFLSPDGTPFWGGTYFPKTSRHGLPGFVEILERIAAVWREQRAAIGEQGEQVKLAFSRMQPRLAAQRATLDAQPVRAALEVLRARMVKIAGVVMVGVADAENRLAIERYGRVRVIGELPMLVPLDSRSLGRWAQTSLDSEGRLMECFR